MIASTFDGVRWLQTSLALRHFRTTNIKLTIRTFAVRGAQFKCDDGPWRDTLQDAIEAHKLKHTVPGGTQG